jgi:DNA invertase Pin-like site-specific DNA recombinase
VRTRCRFSAACDPRAAGSCGVLLSKIVQSRAEIDTTTSMGKFFFHLMGAVAELERDIIRERTQAGLAAARARGRVGGRRPKLTAKQIAMGQALYATREHTVREICDQLDCSPATFYRSVRPVTDAAH